MHLRLVAQEVNRAPARVDVGQAGLLGDAAGPHRRQDVQHVGLDVVVDLELHRVGLGVDAHRLVRRPVLDDALVLLGPDLLEQRTLGRDIGVGVEDQHLGLRLGLLEVAGHDAGAFVRTGRAAVGRFGNDDRKNAAVRHGFQLAPQRDGLRPGLPGLQDAAGLTGGLQVPDAVPHEIDARGEHQSVIGQGVAAGEAHRFLGRVDRGHRVLHQLHAVPARQVVVGHGDVADLLDAADNQVGDRTRHEALVRFDQRDFDLALAPHPQVLGRRGAAVAAADNDHFAHVAPSAARGGTSADHGRGCAQTHDADKTAPLQTHLLAHDWVLSASDWRNRWRSCRSADRCSPWRSDA